MKIKMIQSLQSKTRDLSKGAEPDVPFTVAQRLVKRGYAEPADKRYADMERAVRDGAPETTSKKKPKAKPKAKPEAAEPAAAEPEASGEMNAAQDGEGSGDVGQA